MIGVLPDRFPLPGERVDVYLPLSLITEDQVGHGRQSRWLGVVARLKPGVELPRAAASLDRIAGALASEHPEDRAFGHAQVLTLHESVVGSVRAPLLLVLCAVGLILLIACVNIANLMLARAAAREHELTVRSALGASRWHLARQLLVEALSLSLTGGALGVALAALFLPVARSLSRAMVPRLDEVGLSLGVLGVAAAVSIATGVLFALAPALLGRTAARYESLRSARTASAGGLRARSALVVAEIALAVILVAGASLAARSMWALTRVDVGFQPEGATVVSYHAHADDSAAIARRHRDILQAVRALPGVTQVGGAKELPLEAMGEDTAFTVPGRPPPAPGAEPHAHVLHVSPTFFDALGIPLLRGSGFPPHDPPDSATFLCNETFARQYLGGLEGVGRSIHVYGMDLPVVGIVGDARQARLGEPAPALLYLNILENPRSLNNLVIRGTAPPLELARQVREVIASIDPQQTVDRVTSMEQIVDDALAPPRLVTVVMGVLGLLGPLLGAIGIFGVLAYFVGQRRRELAIRLALGAQREVVLRSVLARGLVLATVGIGVGLVATLVASSVAGSLLYGLAAQDPPTLAFVCVLLLAVAAIASYLPARRATRVDPAEALRAE